MVDREIIPAPRQTFTERQSHWLTCHPTAPDQTNEAIKTAMGKPDMWNRHSEGASYLFAFSDATPPPGIEVFDEADKKKVWAGNFGRTGTGWSRRCYIYAQVTSDGRFIPHPDQAALETFDENVCNSLVMSQFCAFHRCHECACQAEETISRMRRNMKQFRGARHMSHHTIADREFFEALTGFPPQTPNFGTKKESTAGSSSSLDAGLAVQDNISSEPEPGEGQVASTSTASFRCLVSGSKTFDITPLDPWNDSKSGTGLIPPMPASASASVSSAEDSKAATPARDHTVIGTTTYPEQVPDVPGRNRWKWPCGTNAVSKDWSFHPWPAATATATDNTQSSAPRTDT